MSKYNIITDGSYNENSQTIGMGWVIIPNEDEIRVFSQKLDQSVQQIPKKYRSLASEVLAAICALNSLPDNSHVNLYSDNNVIPDFLNGYKSHFKKHDLR
jgi:ribonuclease HI